MPTELELIALETEFELYLTFTKRLVLNLPDSDDRTRAAIWLQKLRSITNDEQKKLRNEHLKLLLFALHRRSMLSVFEKPPPEELESFHDGLTLLEMTRELIELTEKKQAGVENTGECPLPPVSTSISADLKEYCASQSIPKFGAHVFYAVSNEPIQMWSKSPNCVCPDASEIPNPLQWELRLSRLTDHVLETQAEADRLVAEAEKGDKTEMQMKEHDDTHILPKIELEQVSKKEVPFQWKPDSLLLLHQNYDFTDVGVAEDLEEQGKMQLELDEMALDIVGHSLPGRQKVVVRDPYYKGMPPDFSERRNHGVVDDVSSSTSSDEMESSQAMGSTSYTQDERQSETSRQNGTQNQNFTSEMSTKNLPTSSNDDLGPLARKYLPPSSKSRFGLHLDNDTNEYKVGEMSVSFEGDDILVDFDGKSERFTGTEGLWRLMTQDVEDIDYKKNNFTNSDWNVYKEIIIRANPNRGDSAGMSQFCFLSFACYLFKKWMWQVNGGEEEGKSGGDTFDVNDEGCYF